MNLKNYKATETFNQKHCLGLADYTPGEINQILDLAFELKEKQKNGIPHKLLDGKTLAMIFEKSSTRTRVSFQTGIFQLGGQGLFLSSSDLQMGRGEPIKDTSKVISSMCDGIMIRTFAHSIVEELAEYSSVPVINGLTDLLHPCQALADVMTFKEVHGTFDGKLLCYVGDGNNVAHSLMMACAKVGLDLALACPEDHMPDPEMMKKISQEATKNGVAISIYDDPKKAVIGADAIYTDVWTSMGQEADAEKKQAALSAYQVDEALIARANDDCIFLHCLPAHRGEEVTSGVIDGEQSAVYIQAENRMHVQKALMALLMA